MERANSLLWCDVHVGKILHLKIIISAPLSITECNFLFKPWPLFKLVTPQLLSSSPRQCSRFAVFEIQANPVISFGAANQCCSCPSGTGATSYGLFAACSSPWDRDKKSTYTTGVVSSAAALTFAVQMCLNCQVSMCPEHIKPHLLYF